MRLAQAMQSVIEDCPMAIGCKEVGNGMKLEAHKAIINRGVIILLVSCVRGDGKPVVCRHALKPALL
jgi:hypothetical protein